MWIVKREIKERISQKKSSKVKADNGAEHADLKVEEVEAAGGGVEYPCLCKEGSWILEPRDTSQLAGGPNGDKKTLDITVRLYMYSSERALCACIVLRVRAYARAVCG